MTAPDRPTALELERRAAAAKPLPDDLRPPEQLLFLSLRQIYRDYRSRLLTREEARAEKQKVLAQYGTYAAMLDDTHRLCGIFVTVSRDTEPLRRAFHLAQRKGADEAELLSIARQIIRTATGDTSF